VRGEISAHVDGGPSEGSRVRPSLVLGRQTFRGSLLYKGLTKAPVEYIPTQVFTVQGEMFEGDSRAGKFQLTPMGG
jgi:hypothetical protein